ncbi:ORF906 [White spot syndrome virus]|uniref:ORF906 n=1 Tax=White spot syndrome virus TaxID=342409 RepID=A0A2D3I6G0_9VIRU|nr:ORF906 [White spot syndrome virus]
MYPLSRNDLSRNELKRFWVLADPDIWNSYQLDEHGRVCVCFGGHYTTIFLHQKFFKNFFSSLEFRGWTAR